MSIPPARNGCRAGRAGARPAGSRRRRRARRSRAARDGGRAARRREAGPTSSPTFTAAGGGCGPVNSLRFAWKYSSIVPCRSRWSWLRFVKTSDVEAHTVEAPQRGSVRARLDGCAAVSGVEHLPEEPLQIDRLGRRERRRASLAAHLPLDGADEAGPAALQHRASRAAGTPSSSSRSSRSRPRARAPSSARRRTRPPRPPSTRARTGRGAAGRRPPAAARPRPRPRRARSPPTRDRARRRARRGRRRRARPR